MQRHIANAVFTGTNNLKNINWKGADNAAKMEEQVDQREAKAKRSARVVKTSAEILFNMACAFVERLKSSAIRPARQAIAENITKATMMNIIPSKNNWSVILSASGSVNWGRKARKKMATLGLLRFITMPRQ